MESRHGMWWIKGKLIKKFNPISRQDRWKMNMKTMLAMAMFLLVLANSNASTVSRSFSSTTVQPGADVNVTLTVDVTGTETFYAIDESVPSSWAIKNSGTADTNQAGHLKWIYYNQTVVAPDTTYKYTLTAPSQVGTTSFNGAYMFEGMGSETQIGGQNSVTIICTAGSQCTAGQLCCSGTCKAPACTADAQCDDGDACTADSCSSAGQCAAACAHIAISGCSGGAGGGGGSGGDGSGTQNLVVNISGSCAKQPIIARVLDQGNPVQTAEVKIIKDTAVIQKKTTDIRGNASFVLNEKGDYSVEAAKTGFNNNRQNISIKDCTQITIDFEQSVEVGKTQTIQLITWDGNNVKNFTVLVTYPDKTTRVVSTGNGAVALPVDKAGIYTVVVKAVDFQQAFSFIGMKSGVLVPPINPDANNIVTNIFGQQTVENPDYMIIWFLAITVISGTIIVITKLRPPWFRIFLACTYTTVPFVINYYLKNMACAMTITCIETLILNYLLFVQWKRAKIQAKAAAAQKTLSADIPELPPKPPQAPPTLFAKEQQKTNKI